MYVTSDILYDALSEKWALRRYGQQRKEQFLSLPAFYTPGTRLSQNKVYITRTHELPSRPDTKCVFVCVGSCPTNIWFDWPCEIIHIADSSVDLLTAFNQVQLVFEGVHNWETQMQQLLEKNADVEEMLRISIPVFNNRITIIDYELRIIAYCESSTANGQREIRLSKSFDQVPHEKTMLFNGSHGHLIKERNPYIFKDNNYDNYCINLYLGDVYMGCCSLMEDARPIHEGDYLLFQRFADFIRRALLAQSRVPASPFVTLKTIFSELLQNLPVSRDSLNHALTLASKNTPALEGESAAWVCIVIRSANKGKSLPAGYLCTSLEKILPYCSTIAYEGALVSFCRYQKENTTLPDLGELLVPYLRDMNFRAGSSMPFQDIYAARSYYAQAVNALTMGSEHSPELFFHMFQDHVLSYMLYHSCGEFEPELLLPDGLARLLKHKGAADYWDTLKHYLDNESNASRTANEMFLHRSTLLPRLEKIRTFVDLDTPEQRLYLRMCIYLYEMLKKTDNLPE